MPNYKQGKYINDYNIDSFRKDTNTHLTKIILYDYYIKLFKNRSQDSTRLIQMHPLITKSMLKFSNDFVFLKDSNSKNQAIKNTEMDLDFDGILYKGLYPMDISSKNFLYLKMLKFHFGLMQFFDLYEKYHFDKVAIDEVLMNDYLNKKFINCLQSSKETLGVKVNEFSDFKLISNICVRERLTLFNFLLYEMKLKRGDVKKYINNQYLKVFRERTLKVEYKKIKNDLDFEKDLKEKNINDLISPYNKTY